MTERFHVNCELGPGPVDLVGAEAHHLATVCRLRPGAQVCLFNGDGREYPAEVEDVSRRNVRLRVLRCETSARERKARLDVAAPLPKGDRAPFLIEKLTELGVTAFVPLLSAQSVITPGEGKLDKLERHVIEASKQCGRNVLMSIEAPADWADYLKRSDLPARRLLAHPGGMPVAAWSGTMPQQEEAVAIAIGPEGGFRDEEVDRGKAAGWSVVSLGPRILRVETAAIALASWLTLRA
jgi:16S rRNA (uracil1498-N3)-methyltransferase